MQIPQTSVHELQARLQSAAAPVLLDCREAEEVAICRLPGSLHIPMGDIPARLGELDRRADIVVYCHSGRRSQMVAAFLLEQGFRSVSNLSGGIDAWSREVDPPWRVTDRFRGGIELEPRLDITGGHEVFS